MGSIRRQMNNARWFWFAIGYQCGFAWVVGLIINQLWELIVLGNVSVWTFVAFAFIALIVFQIVRPMPKHLKKDEKILSSLAEASSASALEEA